MYKIIETLNDCPGKYVYMVSFNERKPERYEIELPALTLDEEVVTDAVRIDAILTKVGEECVAADNKKSVEEKKLASIKVVDGKIIV